MPVLITGATGFVGSHLLQALQNKGEQVRVMARRTSDLGKLRELGVEVVDGDVLDPSSLKGKMKGCDTIYHLANIYEWWLADKSLFYKVNVRGTKSVLKEALDAGVEKVVYTSTAEAIGQRKGEIANEETQHSGFFPSDYNKSKYLGLAEAMKMHIDGLPLVVVMPGGVIGPGDPKSTGRAILSLLNQKMSGVLFANSCIGRVYVKDVAEGHILAASRGRVGEKYILSSENHTVREIVEMLCEISGIPVPRKNISISAAKMSAYIMEIKAFFTKKPPRLSIGMVKAMEHGLILDNSKAKRELGIQFTPIKEALAETVQWFWEHGYVPKPNTLRRTS